MRAWVIEGGFGLDRLRLVDREDPRPPPGHVVVRTRACSLNYRDVLMATGRYNPRQPLPLVPLSDGVGVVEEVGEGVASLRPGDRVAGMFAQGWLSGAPSKERISRTLGGPVDGMLAEKVVLPEHGVAPVPPHMSDVEAATLPCAALTAWSALVEQGGVKPGDVVVVQGTGGVSIFALQIAARLGAEVIATSSSDERLARATALGAAHVVNYATTPEWSRRVRELTGKRGADHVVDVGGAATLPQSLKAVRVGGTISVVGNLGGDSAPISVVPILMQGLRVQGVFVGHRDAFLAMSRAFAAAGLAPVVDRVVPFAQAPEAFVAVERGGHFGKICVGF